MIYLISIEDQEILVASKEEAVEVIAEAITRGKEVEVEAFKAD